MPQDRNAELVNNLTQDFARRNEFNQSGARLSDVMMWLNRDGGGSLMWAFSGQSSQNFGEGYLTAWTPTAIDYSNYGATANGGPYVTLDGAAEYYTIPDATWQESLSADFLTWAWVYTGAVGTQQTVSAKYTTAGNLRSWLLQKSAADVMTWTTDSTGAADITVTSTVPMVVDNWYLVAGFFQPSTLMSISVGRADSGSLTTTTLTANVPADLFDGVGPPLTLGCDEANHFLLGRLGVGMGRANVPAAKIQSHLARIFAATRWFYME